MINIWEEHGGPAFPVTLQTARGGEERTTFKGMSLRDWLAGQVMAEMIRLSTDSDGGWSAENVAYGCYNLADAMLKARETTP
jgi:hypothetical protein